MHGSCCVKIASCCSLCFVFPFVPCLLLQHWQGQCTSSTPGILREAPRAGQHENKNCWKIIDVSFLPARPAAVAGDGSPQVIRMDDGNPTRRANRWRGHRPAPGLPKPPKSPKSEIWAQIIPANFVNLTIGHKSVLGNMLGAAAHIRPHGFVCHFPSFSPYRWRPRFFPPPGR